MNTLSKKIVTAILLVLVGFSVVPSAHAAFFPNLFGNNHANNTPPKEIREVRKDIKQEVRDNLSSRAAEMKSNKRWGRAAIASGKVTAIDGATLTIEKDGKSLTILTDDKTQFRRRFWGNGSLSDIAVGHMVNVVGQWTDEAKTTIQARLVRDVSIQKRYGVFFGVVQSLTSNGWVMTTVSGKRENQTVTILSSTKLVNRKEETITQADIVVGHRVRVKGLWDRTNNTVTDVTHVKDFSLPPMATISVTPTPTQPSPSATAGEAATPTVTPTETPVPATTP
jgi:Domain of unknown function (DUF5666)